MQALAGGEDRRLAGAELPGINAAGEEVVPRVLAHPDLVVPHDAHPAIGDHVARILIHRHRVGGQHPIAVADDDAVGADPQAVFVIPFDKPLLGERVDANPLLHGLPVKGAWQHDKKPTENQDLAQSRHSV